MFAAAELHLFRLLREGTSKCAVSSSPAALTLMQTSMGATHGGPCALLRNIGFVFITFILSDSCLIFSEMSALHLASSRGQVEVCRLLIACKADLNPKVRMYDNRLLHAHLKLNTLIIVLRRSFVIIVIISAKYHHCMCLL